MWYSVEGFVIPLIVFSYVWIRLVYCKLCECPSVLWTSYVLFCVGYGRHMFCSVFFWYVCMLWDEEEVHIRILVLHRYVLSRICTVLYVVDYWAYQLILSYCWWPWCLTCGHVTIVVGCLASGNVAHCRVECFVAYNLWIPSLLATYLTRRVDN